MTYQEAELFIEQAYQVRSHLIAQAKNNYYALPKCDQPYRWVALEHLLTLIHSNFIILRDAARLLVRTTQTAVLQQINIILPRDANADWSQSLGYAKGEDVVAYDGVQQTVDSVLFKLTQQHGPVVISDFNPALGVPVAQISRMWCGGGEQFVYRKSSSSTTTPDNALIQERERLTTTLANCESGLFPGSPEHTAESKAILALAKFDLENPDVIAFIKSQPLDPRSEHAD